jgi:hypothetical protein
MVNLLVVPLAILAALVAVITVVAEHISAFFDTYKWWFIGIGGGLFVIRFLAILIAEYMDID